MNNLTQQLEDKKKELTDLESRLNRLNFHLSMEPKSNACKKLIKDRMFDIEKVKAEIAILEQAIAEMQKQRQEILRLLKVDLLGNECRCDDCIKVAIDKQLNQPKTER